ncbi:Oidioi.mRNA.OKI2018_I69.PAR.g12473.t1.cds [Oikopleura dioica]|uniref:Oidioi.mRNA.OKI2018_I69.PAR.g12473.t1.cds n=1 Tax=Oikopleura dioica TaxID=34765 RepID=A0ABN7S4V5_OIKDI|nr:Oidioi.mRNA.OKI2018_I69.PAR.g12473.t1.cds [Oikopleura dioica]
MLEEEIEDKDILIKTMKAEKDAVLNEVKKLANTPNKLTELRALVEKSLEEKDATNKENPFTLQDVKKLLSVWKSHNTTVMVQECIDLADKLQDPVKPQA